MNCHFRFVTWLSQPENQLTAILAGIGRVVVAVFFLKKWIEKCLFYIFLCCMANFSDLTFFCHKWYFEFDFDMINNSESIQKYDVTKGDVEVKKGCFCHKLLHKVTNRATVNKVDCYTMSHFNGWLRCIKDELIMIEKKVCDKCDAKSKVITA